MGGSGGPTLAKRTNRACPSLRPSPREPDRMRVGVSAGCRCSSASTIEQVGKGSLESMAATKRKPCAKTQPRSLYSTQLPCRARSELTNRALLAGSTYLARPAERTWTRGRMALSATRGLRCKPSSTSRPSLGPSLQPWPPDGQHTHRGLADVHEATATTPPGSADTYPVPHDPLAQKVPNYGAVPREAAPLLLKDITEDVSTCASAVRRVTCGCPVM